MPDETNLGSVPVWFADVGMKRFAEGVHMLQQFANTCIFETSEGVVLFDVGFDFSGPRIIRELRSISDMPVKYIIYGHGHADHAFGAQAVIDDARERGHPRPTIIAQENLVKRFDRYREMLPYNEHINRIQFAIPDNIPAFMMSYIYPDETFVEEMTLRLGDTTFELHHAMGETDDAVWAWVPERKTVCVSDLWVWSCPNVGNPFKVQRYALGWARALESVAGKSPELMLPGHGGPIEGGEEIQEALLMVARALRFLNDQVVDMLNRGKWPEEILHSFEWPEEFARSKYLAPIYGHPYFIVHALLRQYHGWYDGNASHLFPSTGEEVAAEVVELVGDPEKILRHAEETAGKGRVQLALHLTDFVIESGSEQCRKALELKVELLERLASEEKSLIARNIFLGGARQIKIELERQEGTFGGEA